MVENLRENLRKRAEVSEASRGESVKKFLWFFCALWVQASSQRELNSSIFNNFWGAGYGLNLGRRNRIQQKIWPKNKSY